MHEKVHELHHAMTDPEKGHNVRLNSIEERLTVFPTAESVENKFHLLFQDIINRESLLKTSLSDSNEAVEILSRQAGNFGAQLDNIRKQINDIGNNGAQRIAEIQTSLRALAEHFDGPANLFGTVWIFLVPESPNVGDGGPRIFYKCNCLNVGGVSCQIRKVVLHLENNSSEQDVEDTILEQQIITVRPFGKFERSGLIKTPHISFERLQRTRFRNVRLYEASGAQHYVDVRVSSGDNF